MVKISVNRFFSLDFFNFCWVFQKFPFFCVILYIYSMTDKRYHCTVTGPHSQSVVTFTALLTDIETSCGNTQLAVTL